MIASTLQSVNSCASRHWDEWKSSAISDEIINLNFRTIEDSSEIDKILNRNNKRRWKHSEDLVPAWCVAGVDPLTDEPTLQGVQVKPDNPPLGKDGKPQKYFGAKDFDTAPLFLNNGLAGYWKSIIDDILKYVLITEGAKKAASGLSIGIPTISIPGVSTCRKKGRLHPLLELFAVLGRTFYLAFDNDVLKKKQVQNSLLGMAKELAAKGSKVMVIMLPEGEAKGMDDYIALHGEEAFKQLIKDALTFEEWKEHIDSLESEDEPYKRKSKVARNFQIINDRWGENLRYNTLKKRVELHGSELPADDVRLAAALEFDVDMSTSDVLSIVRTISKANAYSPVVDYLDEVEAKFPDINPSFLNNLAGEYFGTTDPMHTTYFIKFLVAAVARARKPGEKVDSVFMLASQKQGLYKSTFFRVLFGDDWYSDQLGDASDKDERQKMHLYWCLEWAEFETVYKKKDVATLKNFITALEDVFRAPYDRVPITYPRSCIFVGTTNEQEILNDPTGDRRFWVVPVKKRIDVVRVMRDKDKIWAAANALYKSGFEWKLTDEEESRREILNRDYHNIDPWSEVIETHITANNLKFVSTESLYRLLDIEVAHRTGAESRRISNIMRRLGWGHSRAKIDGVWRRGWAIEQSENKNCDFSQNAIFDGSHGSTSESQSIQDTQVDPCLCHDMDRHGSKGSSFPQVPNNTEQMLIPEIHLDPCPKSDMDQLEPSPHLADPCDPCQSAILTKTQDFFDHNIKPTQPANESTGDRAVETPPPAKKNIGVGQVWWWLPFNQKVEIAEINNRSRKATVKSLKTGRTAPAKYTELYLLPDENWTLNIGHLVDYAGEICVIVGRDQQKGWQLESSSGLFMYAKSKQLKKPEL
ncbi:VapE domain-containing protein [Nostoc piscinale]|uniref:VapE domain-containing protein n=1 Tax=Nostoc piscinale TaxID=224012 RepID=UPI000782C321|nr:VapE domain-containing protein [Nostoc piscinale]